MVGSSPDSKALIGPLEKREKKEAKESISLKKQKENLLLQKVVLYPHSRAALESMDAFLARQCGKASQEKIANKMRCFWIQIGATSPDFHPDPRNRVILQSRIMSLCPQAQAFKSCNERLHLTTPTYLHWTKARRNFNLTIQFLRKLFWIEGGQVLLARDRRNAAVNNQ